jgi:hypothetical protein
MCALTRVPLIKFCIVRYTLPGISGNVKNLRDRRRYLMTPKWPHRQGSVLLGIKQFQVGRFYQLHHSTESNILKNCPVPRARRPRNGASPVFESPFPHVLTRIAAEFLQEHDENLFLVCICVGLCFLADACGRVLQSITVVN